MKKTVAICAAMLILTATLPLLPTVEDAGIYEKTLRLHVIANSDTKEDQRVKLLVRDGVLELLTPIMADVKDREQAEKAIKENESAILKRAGEILAENGYRDKAELALCEEYYPRREYEGVCLPAGRYTSLQIRLGNAKGQNWWCVLFPTLCTSSAKPKDELVDAGFTPGQVRLITDNESPRYRIKFRLLEFVFGWR